MSIANFSGSTVRIDKDTDVFSGSISFSDVPQNVSVSSGSVVSLLQGGQPVSDVNKLPCKIPTVAGTRDILLPYCASVAALGSTLRSTGGTGLAMLTNPSGSDVDLFLKRVVVNASINNTINDSANAFELWGTVAAFTSSVGSGGQTQGYSTRPAGGLYSSGSDGVITATPMYVGQEPIQHSALLPPVQGIQGSDPEQGPFIRFDLVERSKEWDDIRLIPGYSFVVGVPNIVEIQDWKFRIDFCWDEGNE